MMNNIKDSIQRFLWRALGLNPKFQAIDNLYYYANHLLDITKMPPSDDTDLRIMQKCDAVLLAIFDKLCERFGYRYFLSSGTLLGAVRHNGFIPWDDDTDTGMIIEDYEDVLNKLPKVLAPYNIAFKEIESQKISRIGLSYRHEETGIWIDVFPYQFYYSNGNAKDSFESVSASVYSYRKKYINNHDRYSREQLLQLKADYLGDGCGSNKLVLGNAEFLLNKPIVLFDESVIFPLQKVSFEGFQLSSPAQKETFLHSLYGNYMTFPKGVLFPHGTGRDRPPLSQWARIHNVDMNEVLAYLTDVLYKI